MNANRAFRHVAGALRSGGIVFALLLCATLASRAAHADENLPLPLAGEAYGVAESAYDAYNDHRYTESIRLAREAIRQRPDVVELRILLANGQAASGRWKDARSTLDDAIRDFGAQHVLLARRQQIDALIASGGPSGSVGDMDRTTFAIAQHAYRAYEQHDYDAAIGSANEAIARAPDVERLRILLIDALAASGREDEAYATALDATHRFGDTDALRARRTYLGARIADRLSVQAEAARERGDLTDAARLAHEAVTDAPGERNLWLQLIAIELAQNDLAAVATSAHDAAVQRTDDGLMWTLSGYAQAAQHDDTGADADFARALAVDHANGREGRVARVIIADVWLAQGRAQDVLDLLTPLVHAGAGAGAGDDDTTAMIALRIQRAKHELAAQPSVTAHAQAHAQPTSPDIDPRARPIFDCHTDAYGAACDVYAADAGFDAARATRIATERGDYSAAVTHARDAANAVPDDRRYRLALIDALAKNGDSRGAAQAAQAAIQAGMLDGMDDLQAAFLAARAGDDTLAFEHFQRADAAGELPPSAYADAGYSALRSHHNAEGARYLERAIDAQEAGMTNAASNTDRDAATASSPASSATTAATTTTTSHAAGRATSNTSGSTTGRESAGNANANANTNPGNTAAPGTNTLAQTLQDERAAHADATRTWGATASVNYRNGGAPTGVSVNPVPGAANNWQAGTEVWWRPFGSLGEHDFQVYARGYDNFGVAGNEPSGAATLQAALGARVKPFGSVDAWFAIEKILPIGSAVRADWLARAAWSDGFGTALRYDQPSWWTGVAYAELDHYLVHPSTFGTANARFGRTFRIDSISKNLTVFPHVVIGADYDSTIDHSVPIGIGPGVAARWWFRGDRYDTPRSFVDVSLQYRVRIAGDSRARGVFFGTVLSW